MFRKIANRVSSAMGTPLAFVMAAVIVGLWWLSGPTYQYSDTWQLVINTGTTIVTFLMVFLIQNTQNRDSKAIQIKLDELLRATKGARNSFVNMEVLEDGELAMLQREFEELRNKTSSQMLKVLHERIVAEQERRHGITGVVQGAVSEIETLANIKKKPAVKNKTKSKAKKTK